MDINYNFIPEYETAEHKQKTDIVSYAGKLLEILDSPTVVLTLDSENRPVVYECDSKLLNALDFHLTTY